MTGTSALDDRKLSLDSMEPVNTVSVRDAVIERLSTYISANGLQPGARLPSENELATTLGVGRSSVREAISVLVSFGIFERRVGNGTYITSRISDFVVRPLALRIAFDPQQIRHILETRKAIESECAFLAAERATEDEIREIRNFVAEMKEAAKRGRDDAISADFAFHMAIARSAGNPVLLDVLTYVSELIFNSHVVTGDPRGGITPDTVRFHTRIVDAIAARDAPSARRLMVDHLQAVIDRYDVPGGATASASSRTKKSTRPAKAPRARKQGVKK